MKDFILSLTIQDIIISFGLVIALVLAIVYGMNELSTNIASGLVGYLGGNVIRHKGESHNETGNG